MTTTQEMIEKARSVLYFDDMSRAVEDIKRLIEAIEDGTEMTDAFVEVFKSANLANQTEVDKRITIRHIIEDESKRLSEYIKIKQGQKQMLDSMKQALDENTLAAMSKDEELIYQGATHKITSQVNSQASLVTPYDNYVGTTTVSNAIRVAKTSKIPAEFVRTVTVQTLDKAKIKEMLLAGEELLGCKLVKKKHLRIRPI